MILKYLVCLIYTYITIFLEEERSGASGSEPEDDEDRSIVARSDDILSDGPADCFGEGCYKYFPKLAEQSETPFMIGYGNLRYKAFKLIEDKYFETAVITMILVSSLALVSMTNS